jgi:hypothetical protein
MQSALLSAVLAATLLAWLPSVSGKTSNSITTAVERIEDARLDQAGTAVTPAVG